MTGKSTDLVTIDGPMAHTDVIAYLEDPDRFKFEVFEEDPDEVARRIAARDLSAGSAAELFGEVEVIHGKQYVNRPFRLDAVEWRASDIEGDGLPFYGIFSITTMDNEHRVMTCGASGVVRKAAIAADRGWLPQWLKIAEGTVTKSGYKPLHLTSAPTPVATADGEPF